MANIDDVVARMAQIEAALAVDDGVRWFDHLYLAVTRAVASAVGASSFRDPAFMEHLDVVFATRFFDAYDAAVNGGQAPPAWEPLFASRAHRGIAPLQFALCGMNAHINYDLAVALVTAYEDLGGGGPQVRTDRHADFCAVNDLLATVEGQVRGEYATELSRIMDRVFPKAEDFVAHWSIVDARAAAWSSAHVLWSLRGDRAATRSYLDGLGHLVGFAGHGLLKTV
jgi:hypothetical protein